MVPMKSKDKQLHERFKTSRRVEAELHGSAGSLHKNMAHHLFSGLTWYNVVPQLFVGF